MSPLVQVLNIPFEFEDSDSPMRPAFFILIWVLWLGAGAASAAPPSGQLVVTVVDEVTGEPVSYANLVRTDGSVGYLAGADGVVRVSEAPPGNWSFGVSHISYAHSPDNAVVVEAGETTRLRVALTPTDHELETIVVNASQEIAPRRVATGVRSVSHEQAANLPNPTDDVFQMIRILPGVATEDLGNAFHLRGGGVDETLVRIDGLEVRELFHGRDFGGITGIIPFSAVQKIDVYPGGFPAKFGGKLSGAVDIALRSNGEPGWHGSFGANAIAARAFSEHHTDDTSLFVSVREGYLDRVLGLVQDEAVIRPGYRDLLTRYVKRGAPGRSLSLNYLRTQDDVFYEDGINDHTVRADYVEDYLWSTARIALGSDARLTTTSHWTRARQERRIDSQGRDDESVNRLGSRVEFTQLAPGEHLVTVGGQVDHEWGQYELSSQEVVRVSAEGEAESVPDYEERGRIQRTRSAVYVQDEWKPLRSLAFNLGLRGTHDSDSRAFHVNPRTSFALELPLTLMLRGAWGIYEQPPDGVFADGSVSTPTQRLSRSEHFVAGLERRFGDSRVGLDFYDKQFPRLSGVVTRTLDGEVERHVISSGRARGIEAYWNRSTPMSNWWLSYSLGRSEWGDGDRVFSRDFDRLHTLSVSNTFQLSRYWDLGMSYAFHSGTPYTEQRWRRDAQTSFWTLDEGTPNGSRLPDYQRVDVRVGRHFEFEGWKMSVFAEALNVSNHSNVLWYSWGFEEQGGVRVPERTPRTGIPGVPSIGVEITY